LVALGQKEWDAAPFYLAWVNKQSPIHRHMIRKPPGQRSIFRLIVTLCATNFAMGIAIEEARKTRGNITLNIGKDIYGGSMCDMDE